MRKWIYIVLAKGAANKCANPKSIDSPRRPSHSFALIFFKERSTIISGHTLSPFVIWSAKPL
jgi:hypothetical protein